MNMIWINRSTSLVPSHQFSPPCHINNMNWGFELWSFIKYLDQQTFWNPVMIPYIAGKHDPWTTLSNQNEANYKTRPRGPRGKIGTCLDQCEC